MLTLAGELALTVSERKWLEVARRYVQQSATIEELEQSRIVAWDSLGTRSCDFSDPAVNRTRAVICTMFPDSTSNEALDEIINFAQYFVGAGGTDARAIEVLSALLERV